MDRQFLAACVTTQSTSKNLQESRPFQLIAGTASIIGLAITFKPELPGVVWAAITQGLP